MHASLFRPQRLEMFWGDSSDCHNKTKMSPAQQLNLHACESCLALPTRSATMPWLRWLRDSADHHSVSVLR